MGHQRRCCRHRSPVRRGEQRATTQRHLPFSGPLRSQVELPDVAVQVAGIGRGDHLVAVTQQLDPAQAVGFGHRAAPRVQRLQHLAGRKVHHEELCTAGLALIAVAEDGHPRAVTQHAHLGCGQHMAQLGGMALIQLPHQCLRSKIGIGRARHVQRKHRLRTSARGTHHHVLPLAVQVRVGLHQRTIHQEALLLIVPIGQPGHFLHHHVRRIGKALHPVTGAEGMHEALVGPHHHQLLARCGTLLLLQVGTVGTGPGIHRLAPAAHALRQACIALVGGGADEDRCRVDDLAQHVAARPEQRGLVVAVTQQVGHQLPPPDLALRALARCTAGIQQRLLQRLRQLIVALRTPEEVAGTHSRGAAVADNGMTMAPVRHLLGRTPLQIAFPTVHAQCEGLQVARPVTRHERRHELLVAGLQCPVADRHPGGRT